MHRSGPSLPPEDAERDLGLRIARDGDWLYRGSPIRRIELVKLFASVLRREADGATGWSRRSSGAGSRSRTRRSSRSSSSRIGQGTAQRLRLRTNLDEWVTIGPRASAPPAPAGGRRRGLRARRPMSRFATASRRGSRDAVYYELVDLAEERLVEGRGCVGVWSEGHFFALHEQGA